MHDFTAPEREEEAKNETTGSKSFCNVGLGADADYAYKDIAEFEDVVEYKVDQAFRDGWMMARATNKHLRALAGTETGT